MKTNHDTMKVELRRIDVCDLLLACTSAQSQANDGGEKWDALHDKLKAQLEKFDQEN